MPVSGYRSWPAVGPVQRHWLRESITDDCPRCGWHGYFHHYIATIDGDWSAAVCDNCYADLHPGITVTVRFYLARQPDDGRPVAVIRQRTRSDHDYPDIGHFPDRGQAISWQVMESGVTEPGLQAGSPTICPLDMLGSRLQRNQGHTGVADPAANPHLSRSLVMRRRP
jgi:hypothetical protein